MSQRVNTPNKKTLNYSTFSALPHQPGTTNISIALLMKETVHISTSFPYEKKKYF